MVERGQGNWVSSLGGAKPHHMVPTPTSQDHIERQNTNKTPSTGKLNYETNKSVSLDRWVKMWPTPNARQKGGGEYQDPEKILARMEKGYQTNLGDLVKLWPTPRASSRLAYHENPTKSQIAGTHGWNLNAAVTDSLDENPNRLWPTPTVQDSNKATKQWREYHQNSLTAAVFTKKMADPKSGGKLNPQWVAWLMGYPTEYLNSVPWETRSSRRSPKK
tara:strand:- start:58 stop:711 length:654 start_codon:yes stop_codon:yes gene_type:complete